MITKPLAGTKHNKIHPLARGLVAGYLLNEGSGSAVYDFVNGIKGTLSSTALLWTGSKYGSAIKFDGTNRIDVPSAFGVSATNISICVWVNINSLSTKGAFVKIGGTNSGFGIGQGNTTFDNNGGNIIILYEFITWQVAFAATLGDHFFCFTNGTSNSYVYNDGALRTVGSGGVGNNPITQSYIGGYSSATADNRHCSATVGMVRVYNRQLGPSEIMMLNNNPFTDFDDNNKLILK